MILTKEEFAVCSQWEDRFRHAQAGVMYTLGRVNVQTLMGIFARVTGKPAPKADRCGSCELRMQKQVGKWYFEDKAALEAKSSRKRSASAVKKLAQAAKNIT